MAHGKSKRSESRRSSRANKRLYSETLSDTTSSEDHPAPSVTSTVVSSLPAFQSPLPVKEHVIETRKKHLPSGLYTAYEDPVMLVQTQGQYVYDEKGRRYLDGHSNVQSVGHCHPKVVAAMTRAAELSTMGIRYLNHNVGAFAEKLKTILPKELDSVIFCNSGSEANDLAIRIARMYTKRNGLVAVDNGYHGTTGTCIGVSRAFTTGKHVEPEDGTDHFYYSHDVRFTPTPNHLRGLYKFDEPNSGKKYAKHVLTAIEQANKDKDVTGKDWRIAAFICETIQGVSGQQHYPPGFLKYAYKHVRKHGGVCIADEVQVGYGRCGTHYWVFETQGVVPDMVVVGKPMGNGFPVAAIALRREIAEAFNKCKYYSTTGCNPVACAVGIAVLDVLFEEKLKENALKQSTLLWKLLGELQKKHDCIAEIKGIGLFVGIEIVKDLKTLEPDADRVERIGEICKANFLLIGDGGPLLNIIRIKPPLCINEEDIRFMVATIDKALTETSKHRRHSLVGRMSESQRKTNTLVDRYLLATCDHRVVQQFRDAVGHDNLDHSVPSHLTMRDCVE